MSTRLAAAREAAFIASTVLANEDLSSSSAIPASARKRTVSRNGSSATRNTKSAKLDAPLGQDPKISPTKEDEGDVADEATKVNLTSSRDSGDAAQVGPPSSVEVASFNINGNVAGSKKSNEATLPTQRASTKVRKSAAPRKRKGYVINVEPVRGGWDDLPHNIGKLEVGVAGGGDTAHPDASETLGSPPKKRARRSLVVKTEKDSEDNTTIEAPRPNKLKSEEPKIMRSPANRIARGRARKIQSITPESSDDIKVHLVTQELKEEFKEEFEEDTRRTASDIVRKVHVKIEKPKKTRPSPAKMVDRLDDVQQKVTELLEATDKPARKIKKGKANPYGLTPGYSPFPDFAMPTIEACKQVEDALSEVHGKVVAPQEIPAPSLEVTGCGEVPSVLDALIRTRLSASTTSQNAKYAFAGLVERYGVLEEGIGAGSVDWNKVRESDVQEIEKAIKKGGLAKTKSKSIKKILEMVYDLNAARRDVFIKEKEGGDISDVVGAENMTQGQKDMEINVANKNVLSLDFMHGLNAEQAMSQFVKYPGIGVKTASCVILFCLQRPSFAVDTHVWRFCKWLKWIPEGATRDQTFSHCEVRIPDSMKYSLHQLFIRHGKTCGRCRAATGEGSEGWDSTVCPIEHLVERIGKRKAGGPVKKTGAAKKAHMGKKGKKSDEWDGDDVEMDDVTDEESELDDKDDGEEGQSTRGEDD